MSPEDLIKVLEDAGASRITNRGRNIHACCPFHEERNPSFGISVEEPHLYGCFGCGVRGTVLNILTQKLGYTFQKASQFLKLRQAADKNIAPLKDAKRAQKHILEEVLYPYWLHVKARKYLYSRGIRLRTMIEAGLKYAPEFNRVIFPWRFEGKLHTVTGRTLDKRSKLEAKTIPLFESKKSTTLYIPQGRIDSRPFVLVEGEIDALAVYQAATTNVGGLGHGAFARKQIEQIANADCKEVVLFFDNDKTGMRLAAEAVKFLGSSKSLSMAVYPRNRFSAKSDPAALSPKQIRQAISLRKQRIQWALEPL